jgi:hypothetical protein
MHILKVAAFLLTAASAVSAPLQFSIVSASGDVKLTTDSGSTAPEVGGEITPGTKITTGEGGELIVLISNVGVVKISPGTSVTFSSLSNTENIPPTFDATFDLTQGSLAAAIDPKSPSKLRMTVDTPNCPGVSAGNVFSVNVRAKTSQFIVSSGSLDWMPSSGGQNKNVSTGNSFTATGDCDDKTARPYNEQDATNPDLEVSTALAMLAVAQGWVSSGVLEGLAGGLTNPPLGNIVNGLSVDPPLIPNTSP